MNIKIYFQIVTRHLAVLLLLAVVFLTATIQMIHTDKTHAVGPEIEPAKWDLNGPPVYVNATASGSNNGTSWINAYTNLRQAIESTGSPCQIWVAAGEYTPVLPGSPGQRTDAFQMKNGFAICGGFPNTGSPTWADRDREANPTLLTGDIGIPFNDTDNCYHVFYHPESLVLDDTAILDGFIIQDGNATGTWHEDHPHGGGMYNRQNASPAITNCTFFRNSAHWDGGGMFNWNSSPHLTDCHFDANTAEWGGAMYNLNDSPQVTNCNFTQNTADIHGGGIYNSYSDAILVDCTFTDNEAGTNGGGMYNDHAGPDISGCQFELNTSDAGGGIHNVSSLPLITNCEFTENSADSGGGIFNTENSIPQLINCDFWANTAESKGGAVANDQSSPAIIGCTFSLNKAVEGGGIHNAESSSPEISDCTFTQNSAPLGGGLLNHTNASPLIANCNFWHNSGTHGGGAFNFGGSPVFVNCVFSANTALMGGGIANSSFLPPFSPFELCNSVITNCTFWNNTSQNGGGISNNQALLTLTNSILWEDIGGEVFNINTDPNITYCNIQTTPGSPPCSGIGNINGTPMFVNPGSLDFHLMPDSPCIDAGINSAPHLWAKDFEGDKRTVFCIADMGADEYSSIWVYDTNLNFVIDFPEMVDALMDYLTGCISFSHMMDILMDYLAGPPSFNLQTTSTIGGDVEVPGEGTFGPYVRGTKIDLQAQAESGWFFDHWTGDIAGIIWTRA